MMMRRLTVYILSLLLLSLIAGCVHQFPTPNPADVVVTLEFDTSLPLYKEHVYTKASTDAEDYDARYVIECYRKLNNGSYSTESAARFVFTQDDISELDNEFRISLDEGDYIIRAWTDYVNAGSAADKFYNCDNFSKIFLTTKQANHEGNNDFRDAFFGHQTATVVRYGSNVAPVGCTIKMQRPLAKIEFRSTDLKKFMTETLEKLQKQAEIQGKVPPTSLDLDDYFVTIYYPMYMPNSFNVMADNNRGQSNDSNVNYRFNSPIRQIDENTAMIGFDYVFVPAVPHTVSMQVGLYAKDANSTQLSLTNEIRVPVLRDKLTIVTGEFFTQGSGGGVSINPDFDGDFNIVIP